MTPRRSARSTTVLAFVLLASPAAAANAVLNSTTLLPVLPGAFDDYLCNFTLPDAVGSLWNFDLRFVANQQITVVGGNRTFVVSPCGVPLIKCAPAGGYVGWPYAPAMQIIDSPPPCNMTLPECVNPVTGLPICCTGNCELMGLGVPQWQLVAPQDAGAGLVLEFDAFPALAQDLYPCPFDPIKGAEVVRTMTVVHTCDPTVPVGTVITEGVAEDSPCKYVTTLRSAAACPVAVPSGPGPQPSTGPAVPFVPGPLADYLCQPTLTDATGVAWAFDLTPLSDPAGFTLDVSGGGGSNLTFGVCVVPDALCAPGYPVTASYGAGVQYFGPDAPPQQCQMPNGSPVPCTRFCEIVGTGAPLWSLLDPASGKAGVVAQFAGISSAPGDPYQCPSDPASGLSTARTLRVQLTCDPSVPVGTIADATVAETQTCTYVVTGSSAAACASSTGVAKLAQAAAAA
jgi:hypothetical protein